MGEFKVLQKLEDVVKGVELELGVINRQDITIPNFQREVSEAHIKRLVGSISKIGFLTFPIITETSQGEYYLLDGQHRILALDIVKGNKNYDVIVVKVPPEIGSYFLEFNTEKPPTIKEKAKQVYELYIQYTESDMNEMEDLAIFIEEPYLITIGITLKEFGDISVSPFQNYIKKLDSEFFDMKVGDAYQVRKEYAQLLYKANEVMKSYYQQIKTQFPKIVPYEVQNKIVAYTVKSKFPNTRKLQDETNFKEFFDFLIGSMQIGFNKVINELYAKNPQQQTQQNNNFDLI